MELRNGIERSLGLRVPTTAVWNHPTVKALAGYLIARLTPDDATGTPAAPSLPSSQDAAPVDAASDEQALRSLMEGR